MKISIVAFALIALFLFCFFSCQSQSAKNKKSSSNTTKEGLRLNELTDEEKYVILNKGTDMPFTGELTDNFKSGTYFCRQCNAPLYHSTSKFHSNCGWPSFDDEIKGAVKKTLDADGERTEITCNRCHGHLGHVFYGEGFTATNARHCVNTTSLVFVETPKNAKAIFAGGCFWGVEYYFQNEKGVKSTSVGYTGGNSENPTYEAVSSHTTGHYEAIEITYDPKQTNYEALAKLFFEIHDPTQVNGQGNDIGQQYQSMVFYLDESQKAITEKLINTLKKKGYKIATQIKPANKFWTAEEYHQRYYAKEGGTPYCHKYVKRF
ncbi:bifunctional methionine sulfoxide reductase B/A protein [Emticicia sp. SJ17W-69]|uniref:bifunctional methionine sulfoxide reductase B/A protein n=1 Tax=Emticicia sp. SJ17W-69 TaxID=3421657 RepID=UPI003EC0AFF4